MKQGVHFFYVVAIDMRIDLRRCDIGMPKHLLDSTEICAALKQMRCKRMPEHVWVHMLGDVCSRTSFLDDLPHRHS